ncbi:MAG TPA: helix-turn-helix transcriptional regulator [Longimicrobiales bacterium]|nr:helix-turn-helix transcriptional regulator [Longimicrobiales bacterium]
MDEDRDRRLRWIYIAALVSIVVGGTLDLWMDRPRRWLSFHVVFETLMVAGALLMATTLWLGWWRAERSIGDLRRTLEQRRAERDAWQTSARLALEGLGRAIDERFRAWGLTPAEREVALLLLKGHSHKHIARDTGRSDRTVRQHAAAVYEKAGLAGRAELAAFFLEDLMLPAGDREVAPPAAPLTSPGSRRPPDSTRR